MGIDNVKFAKPAHARWSVVQRSDTCWAIYSPEGQVFGTSDSKSKADAIVERKQKEVDERAGKKDRPCMCCRSVFASEGIHNRLCDRCRRSSDALPEPYGIASGSRGARKTTR